MADNGKKKKSEGNLIEVATLMFLAAVVVGVLYPGVSQVQKQVAARENLEKCEKNLIALHEALDAFATANHGRFATGLGELTSQKMLAEIPRCPSANKVTYEGKGYRFKQGDPGRYTIMCFGNAHLDAGLERNEPLYDSLYGLKPAPGGDQGGKK